MSGGFGSRCVNKNVQQNVPAKFDDFQEFYKFRFLVSILTFSKLSQISICVLKLVIWKTFSFCLGTRNSTTVGWVQTWISKISSKNRIYKFDFSQLFRKISHNVDETIQPHNQL